jgi:hypothetical protein
MTRRCIFCDASDVSNEHILGRWLVPHLPGAGDMFTHTRSNEQGLPTDTWTNSGIDLKVKRVCRTVCNAGWMQELDQAVSPIVSLRRWFMVCPSVYSRVVLPSWPHGLLKSRRSFSTQYDPSGRSQENVSTLSSSRGARRP